MTRDPMNHDEQDAQVLFYPVECPPEVNRLRPRLLAAIRGHLGWPPLDMCMDESVAIVSHERQGPGWTVKFEYCLDHDWASQYDRTETTRGEATLGPDGEIVDVAWEKSP